MERRQFLRIAGCGAAAAGLRLASRALAADAPKRKEPRLVPEDTDKLGKPMPPTQTEDKVNWYDVRHWGVEGKGWADTERYFDRLPARAKDVVRPPVWGLSR